MGLFWVGVEKRGSARVWLGRVVFLFLVVVLVVGGGWWEVRAQFPDRRPARFSPDSSATVESLLRNAEGQVQNQQWAEAIEIYQRIIDKFGDKVSRVGAGREPGGGEPEFLLFADDRTSCQRAIAALPAEARGVYRARMDGEAEQWYRQGLAGDRAALRRVIERAFCSSWGDEAAEVLGDLAFQEGRLGQALALYQMLVREGPADPLVLVHPDPSVDLARVAAKILLCRAAQGIDAPSAADLENYARRYPDAAGSLAGRHGLYREILVQALANDRLAVDHEAEYRWPTFAGSPRRTKVLPGPVDVGSIQWRVELEKVTEGRFTASFGGRGFGGNAAMGLSGARLLAFHPIVIGDQVILADGSRVLAYNLSDRPGEGETAVASAVEPIWKQDPDEGQTPRASRVVAGVPRYTLTAYGRRVFVRMGGANGPYFPGMGIGAQPGRSESSIMALDWNAQGKQLWERKASSLVLPNGAAEKAVFFRTVCFEGTPVADADGVYAAVVDRREQIAAYVVSLDAETGATRWIRYVGTGPASGEGDFMGGAGFPMMMGPMSASDSGHRLLALDGSTIYFLTNLGALIALDAETGRVLWTATYPRSEALRGSVSDRDLNPAVVDQGRVFVAPADADAIFAFDARTGRVLWKTDAIPDDVKLAHLLGVARGRLVATGDRVLLFDAATGKLVHAWPDSGKSLDGYGRGLLAGDFIYLPTLHEIQILDQRTGRPAEQPIKLREAFHTSGGNLAAGDGYLVVAQKDGLVVFCQNSRLIERYRQQIARRPERASNYFRLARAAEALGRDREALEAYREAGKRAGKGESIDGVSLVRTAREHEFRLLLRLADLARKSKDWDGAIADLAAADRAAAVDGDRLRARLRLADVYLDLGRAQAAVEVCERILADDRLRVLAVAADGRRNVRADLLVADRLGTIIQRYGRSVYGEYDREARSMLERGRSAGDARVLAAVARLYPVAEAAPEALFALGSVEEKGRRLTEAAAAYKQLLELLGDDPRRGRVLGALARVYEERGLLGAARECYLEIKARYGSSADAKLRALAADAARVLARAPYDRVAETAGDVAIPFPLERRFVLPLDPNEQAQILTAVGVAPAADAGRLFLADSQGLRLIDPRAGSAGWTITLGEQPVWAAYHGDKLIAAAANRIVAVEFGQAVERWRYEPPAPEKNRERPDPFAEQAQAQPAGARLAQFQLVKGRLYFRRGQDELVALDAETGAVEWSFRSAQSTINPNLWIGPERIVLQIDKPNQILVLHTSDGRPLARAALNDKERLERPPLPLDENSVALVPDRLTVKRFDLDSGQFTWAYQESDQLPINGPPALLGDGARLLVIHDGQTLIRLNSATGSKIWTAPLGFEDLSERPGALALDESRVYCVSKKTLRALSLKDGRTLWTRPLIGPLDSSWSIAATEHHLVVYPREVAGVDASDLENMPVGLRSKKTGALLQRFAFATSSRLDLRLDARGVVIASARGIWGLGARPILTDRGGSR